MIAGKRSLLEQISALETRLSTYNNQTAADLTQLNAQDTGHYTSIYYQKGLVMELLSFYIKPMLSPYSSLYTIIRVSLEESIKTC